MQREADDRQERLDHAHCKVAGLRQEVASLQKQLTAVMSEAAAARKLAHEMESPQQTPPEQTRGIAAPPGNHQHGIQVFHLVHQPSI